ncbi:MAG: EMC3/TMCO1 family protein [Candidatus Asgardarchaeia archaeon]
MIHIIFAQMFDWILSPIYQALEPFKYPPASTLFVTFIAFLVVLFASVVNKKMIDFDKVKRYRKELMEYNKLRMQALKTNDEKLMAKVKRLKPAMDKKQAELMSMQFKPMLIYMIPLLLLFQLLASFYTHPVAYIPANLAVYFPYIGNWLGYMVTEGKYAGLFGFWFGSYYFLAAIVCGGVINKLLGISLQ